MGQCNCRKKRKVYERRCGTGRAGTPGGVWGAGVTPHGPHPLEHSPGHGVTQSSVAGPAASWSQTPAEETEGCFGVR